MTAGKQTLGPYSILRTLGKGGMGVVYAVADPDVDRPLALKLIQSRDLTPGALARFLREASVLAKIKHRNVVRIHRAGELPEGPYLLEELIEGETLESVSRRGGLPPQETARVLRDLCDAVAAIHGQGILHRDLKPANVVLQDGRVPVLLDFGVARELDSKTLTKTGAALGTPAYMSPEQADGDRAAVGPPTDVYGLGAILFELLAGEKPYTGSLIVVIKEILSSSPSPRPSAVRPGVAPELEAICLKAMAKDVGARYPTAEAMRDDLDRVLEGQLPKAAVDLRQARTLRLVRYSLVGAVGVALLSAALAAGLRSGAPSETARTLAPAPAPAREPAPRPLWDLAPGTELAYLLTFEERLSGLPPLIRFRGSLILGVTSVTETTALIAGTLTRVRAGVSVTTDADYDTQRPDEGHFLHCLAGAVGERFHVELDTQTGAVTVRDMTRIGEKLAVAAESSESPPIMPQGQTLAFLRTTFSDVFFSRAFSAMTNVRGGSTLLPWKKTGPHDGYLLSGEVRECLPPVATRSRWVAAPSSAVFALEGKLRFENGKLVHGEVRQSRANEGRAYVQGEDCFSQTTWSLTLQE